MLRIRAVLVVMVLTGLIVGTAQANPVAVPNPNWYEFVFGGPGSFATNGSSGTPSSGGNSQAAPDPPWTFTSASPVRVTITDAFDKGDSFSLFNNSVLVGSTPAVPSVSGSVSDPAITSLDPTWSHAQFVLPAGPSSLTIRADSSPEGAGAAYFRLDIVPEPASLGLMLVAGAFALCSRRRSV